MDPSSGVSYNAARQHIQTHEQRNGNGNGNQVFCGWRKVAIVTGVLAGIGFIAGLTWYLTTKNSTDETGEIVCNLISRCVNEVANCTKHGIRTILNNGLDEYCGFTGPNGTLVHSDGQENCCKITNLTNFATKRDKVLNYGYGHNGKWRIGQNVVSTFVEGFTSINNYYNVNITNEKLGQDSYTLSKLT